MRFVPSFEHFFRLASQPDTTVVPVALEMVADTLTPVLAYAALSAGGAAGAFLLESVIGGERWARYSFVGLEPELIVQADGNMLSIDDGQEIRTLEGGLLALKTLLSEWQAPTYAELEALDLPRFWGGAVGYLGYDMVGRFEPTVGSKNSDGTPLFAFGIGATLVAFDGLRQTLKVIVPVRVPAGEPSEQRCRDLYKKAKKRASSVAQRLRTTVTLPELNTPIRDGSGPVRALPPSSFERAAYIEAVETCKEHIRAGDIFQVVLAQRFEWAEELDPFTLYRALRVVNPSPYMFHLRLPGVAIAGASPETLVRVQNGTATLRPIAGTRPRGRTRADDEALADSLRADPKERAEHVMLVDLARNDLGRVSKIGGVRITQAMEVERYSHVMHMTSNVEGTVRDGLDAFDVIAATFPAGTLSGAPKIRAMQIIDDLEPVSRGLYGGAVGYIGFDGSLDMAIAIRSVEMREGRVALQAGAGIVEASDPETEWEETLHKASAALVAVEMARNARTPAS